MVGEELGLGNGRRQAFELYAREEVTRKPKKIRLGRPSESALSNGERIILLDSY